MGVAERAGRRRPFAEPAAEQVTAMGEQIGHRLASRTPARGVVRSLACAVALTLVPAPAPCDTPGQPWTRLDTPSFTFFSNATTEVTHHYAAELENFRRFVAQSLGDGAVATPLPTEVYLFADREDFADYRLGERNVGWFTSTRQANVIAIDTSSTAGTEVAYHEYVHFVVENSTPAVPLWLNEGLAEFYSTFEVVGDELHIGRRVDRHVEFLRRNRLLSFDELFAVDRHSPEYTEEQRRGVFYAQSWAFVHYLVVGQNEFHVEVGDFLRRLRDGVPADEAYRAAFGTSTVGLRRDLEHYIGQASFEYLVLPATAPPAAALAPPTVLDEAEATARLGLLRLVGKVGEPGEARAAFSRALAADPANATALRGLGELDLQRGDFRQAAAWFAEALVVAPGDVASLDLRGLALLQDVQSALAAGGALDPAQRAQIEEARSCFAQAISRAPDFAPALAGFGTTFFWDDDPSEGIAVSSRAVRLLPRNPVIVSTHLALVAQAGEVEQARRVYAWLRRPAVRPTEQNLADAERALFNAEFQHLVRAYRRPDQYPALLEGLEGLIDRAPDPQVLAQLRGQIEQLRDVVERNNWADAYNRALDLLEAGRRSDGIELLQAVAAGSTDSALVEQARLALGAAAADGR
jgi:tetratricopeptide (TPR) repeat protein